MPSFQVVFSMVVVLTIILAHADARAGERLPGTGQTVVIVDVADLRTLFERHDYRLEQVRRTRRAPSILVERLPHDLASEQDVTRLERVFFRIVLPLAATANKAVRNERARLLSVHDRMQRGLALDADDKQWLEEIAAKYNVEDPLDAELLQRVDTVPVGLVLAQAAEESGWGRSHIALTTNGLFGQHAGQANTATVKARSGDVALPVFNTLLDSVRSYIHNLNTNSAYVALRHQRAAIRARGERLSAFALAEALTHYSAIGKRYTSALRSIVHAHALDDFDTVTLLSPHTIYVRPSND